MNDDYATVVSKAKNAKSTPADLKNKLLVSH